MNQSQTKRTGFAQEKITVRTDVHFGVRRAAREVVSRELDAAWNSPNAPHKQPFNHSISKKCMVQP